MKLKRIIIKRVAVFILPLLITALIAVFANASVITLGKKDGLVSSLAKNIYINETTIWFAAGKAGASFYDKQSEEIKTYAKGDKIVTGEVNDVVTAFNKTWFGTTKSLNVIDEGGKVTIITEVEVPHVTKKGVMIKAMMNNINDLSFVDGSLWVSCFGVNGGLYKFDGANWEEVRLNKSPINYARNIKVFGDDVWFGTAGFGIIIYNKNTRKWGALNSSTKGASLPNDSISGLAVANGKIFAGTGAGVCEIKKEKDGKLTVKVYDVKNTNGAIKSDITTSLAATENGDIFAGTTMGIAKYSDGVWEELKLAGADGKTLKLKRIYSLSSDGDTLWAGSNLGVLKIE